MPYLDQINSPADLKQLTIPQLNELAKEVRELILSTVCKTGGHLSSSLGVVELTIALHYVFDSPKDKIVWDVSHQSYAHKILTGRKDRFHTLRQYGGISGFTKISESEHDIFGAGHSSTSVSAALGLAVARDLKKEKHEVIAVIGDGALTGGLAYEGLNNVGNLNTDITVILNDNKMSISNNVGAISEHLKKLSMIKIEGKERGNLGTIFENLNFYYIPHIDGHNIEALVEGLKMSKDLHGPLLMHIMTKKGEGYKIAESNASKYHGVSAFDLESGCATKNDDGKPKYSNIFGETLIELAKEDDKIIGITAAMPAGTGMEKFAEQFHDRFFDVGIAEQHALTFSAGLAREGMKPFAAIYSTFVQRAYDQIIHDIALQKLPVKIMLDRAGLVGDDGPTHHGAFDLSFLRLIPNLVITAPKDEAEFKSLMRMATNYNEGPFIIRYPRGSAPKLNIENNDNLLRKNCGIARGDVAVCVETHCNASLHNDLQFGKNEILKQGDDITIIAIGTMVEPALKAAEKLTDNNISATVINCRFLKPLDEELILNNIKNKKILTVEENTIKGGLGSAVLELLETNSLIGNVQVKIMGIPDHFIEHGDTKILLEKIGLTSEEIYKKAKEMIG